MSIQEGTPPTLGSAYKLATLLGNNVSAAFIGWEQNKAGTGLDIIIGLQGDRSKQEDMIRVTADDLASAFGWAQARCPEQMPQLQTRATTADAHLKGPLTLTYKYGGLTNS